MCSQENDDLPPEWRVGPSIGMCDNMDRCGKDTCHGCPYNPNMPKEVWEHFLGEKEDSSEL